MNKFDLNKLIRSNIKALEPYSSARDEYSGLTNSGILLDANENPFNNGINRYPDPLQLNLKKRLADLRGVPVNQILLGNGSDEVLDLVFRAFCEPGVDNVCTLPPTYGMYQVLAGINNIENRTVTLTSDFQPDVENILRVTDEHSKILFLCSPNNPTGNVFNSDIVRTLLESYSGLVVIDEAYIDFAEDPGWLGKLNNYPNLIVTQTLSKAFGMASVRLGICFASKEIIAVLNTIKPPYNVNGLSQEVALKELGNIEDTKDKIQLINDEKKKLTKLLEEVSFVREVFSSEANFLLVKVDDAKKRYHQLLEAGIIVRNRSNQPLCDNCLRISIGTRHENNRLTDQIKKMDL